MENKNAKRISEINGDIIIAGAGETGQYAIEEIHKSGEPFVVIESKYENTKELAYKLGDICYIRSDGTDEDVLINAGILIRLPYSEIPCLHVRKWI